MCYHDDVNLHDIGGGWVLDLRFLARPLDTEV